MSSRRTGTASSRRITSAGRPSSRGRRQRSSPQRANRREWCSPACTQGRASRSTRSPSQPSTAGSSVSVASRMNATESMIPSAIERNAGLGTSITADNETSTVTPEKSTALPAVSIVTATASRVSIARAEVRSAEAGDDEERVVDPQREREHEREVHRPDRDVEELGDEEEAPRGRRQPENRQQERQPRRDQRAEREQQDRQRHRPGETSDFSIARLVGLVEVGPHAGSAGEADACPGVREGFELALQIVRRAHHLRWARGSAAAENHSASVLGDLRRSDRGDALVSLEDSRRGRDDRDAGCLAVDNDHQRVPALPSERGVDRLACGDGLRPGCLPAGARERVLGPRVRGLRDRPRRRPRDDDEPKCRRPSPSRRSADPGGASAFSAANSRLISFRKHGVRPRTTEAGQAPNSANSHWLRPRRRQGAETKGRR